MDTKTYNGWTNYETWCVNLWLTNDQASYEYWNTAAREQLEAAPDSRLVWDDNYLVRNAARYLLADQLRDELKDADIFEEPNLFTDLLTAALDRVDWQEIAEAFVSEIEPPATTTIDMNQSAQRVRVISGVARFLLGQVYRTVPSMAIPDDEVAVALSRHERGDWGLVCQADWDANEQALQNGDRLLSVYESKKGTCFWIITEANRSTTTVQLPGDY